MTTLPYAWEVLSQEQMEELLAITPEAVHHLNDASVLEKKVLHDPRTIAAAVTRRLSFALVA